MARIAEILVRVRDSLADDDKTRWSDARLLRLIDEAQKKIVKKAKLLRTKTDLLIIGNQNIYQLPSDAMALARVVNEDGGQVGIKSHAELDELLLVQSTRRNTLTNKDHYHSAHALNPDWENDTGNNTVYIVFDLKNPGQIQVYPIPNQTDGGEDFVLSDFGIAATIESDILSSDYGVVVDVSTSAVETKSFNSVYGVLTDMQSIVASLVVYYYKKPASINAIDISPSILEIDDMYDVAIKHYVIGTCFADDQDTQNIIVSRSELKKYREELEDAKKDSAKNFTNAPKRLTTYNPGI